MTVSIGVREGVLEVGSRLQRAGEAALGLLYPPLCLICRAPVGAPHGLCGLCWNKITFIDGPVCTCCGLPFDLDPGANSFCGSCLAHRPAFDHARAAMCYDDGSRDAILALKRADRLEFSRLFATWLRRTGRELIEEADLIAPVPLHRLRLWLRRYNQSALLAQRLSRLTGKPFDPFLLVRVRPTPSQGKMPSAKARRRNVRGAFDVPDQKREAIGNRVVLLVDDVLTTGATVNACAQALKRAGVAKVLVLTIARVARPLPRVV